MCCLKYLLYKWFICPTTRWRHHCARLGIIIPLKPNLDKAKANVFSLYIHHGAGKRRRPVDICYLPHSVRFWCVLLSSDSSSRHLLDFPSDSSKWCKTALLDLRGNLSLGCKIINCANRWSTEKSESSHRVAIPGVKRWLHEVWKWLICEKTNKEWVYRTEEILSAEVTVGYVTTEFSCWQKCCYNMSLPTFGVNVSMYV